MTHVRQELHDLLSGRVTAEERRRIEEHLQTCEQCRAEQSRLAEGRALLRHFADVDEPPAGLRERIGAALDGEQRIPKRRRAMVLGRIAAAVIIILAATLLLRRPDLDIPASAVRDYHSFRDGQSALEFATSDVAEMERWLDARLPFPTRVFDFAMMQYDLIGGRIGRIAGHPSAVFIYRKNTGELVVCQMYKDRVEQLPAASETREHDGIRFFIYERDGVTSVFWQEGEVVCVLASEVPREEAVSLAFAKAMKV